MCQILAVPADTKRPGAKVLEDVRISNFVYSASNYKLQDPNFDASAWDWIVAMAKLDLQFEVRLNLWLKQPTPNAFVQLANAATENALIRLIGAIPAQRRWIVDRLLDEIAESGVCLVALHYRNDNVGAFRHSCAQIFGWETLCLGERQSRRRRAVAGFL
ncbi:hypothetical protein HFN87_01265 [Rhizobium laguerreae]|uniref:hypothetical protein n=1 Tax=Rhizobium laguerreae TaxID=1076926 RepID=UPI001C8FCD52|nr:hypothetical protein [Rhizobium laguerreae]MBY3411941.1 hypothetical protein [Rhizobium laguerreae]